MIVHGKQRRAIIGDGACRRFPLAGLQTRLIVADRVAEAFCVDPRQRIKLAIFAAAGTGFQRDRG